VALDPVSTYGRTNHFETFAEAFAAWFYPAAQVDAHNFWLGWSKHNSDYFDALVGQL
jgi:hypothetical protein